MENIDLTLVIPCYNEGKKFEENTEKLINILEKTSKRWEIIFVDDFSQDDTRKNIEKIITKYPKKKFKKIFHSQNIGRGRTVTDGIKITSGEIIGFIDIDLEISPNYIPNFVQKILEGADMVIGQRIYKFHWRSPLRYITSKIYSILTHRLLKLPFKDTEVGYKFFRRLKILPLLDEIKDPHWFWDTECVARAYFHNLKIAEIPVVFIRDFEKKSTVKLIPDGLYYLKKIFKFWREIKNAKLCE